MNRTTKYEVWDLCSGNLCEAFATESLAAAAAQELSELNPGVAYGADCVPSADNNWTHLGIYIDGEHKAH